MNWEKLFEKQALLMDCIGYKGEDKKESLQLALAVEAAECANEWRGFKYWSKKRDKPKTIKRVECLKCAGFGIGTNHLKNCPMCNGSGTIKINPLLEEYTDLVHFALERVIETEEINMDYIRKLIFSGSDVDRTITEQFNEILYLNFNIDAEEETLAAVYHLGGMLGFSDEQIEAAYEEKWQINIQRQEAGY